MCCVSSCSGTGELHYPATVGGVLRDEQLGARDDSGVGSATLPGYHPPLSSDPSPLQVALEGYCDLLEEEVHALRQQIAFLKDVADGARPITSPRACLEVGGATPAAKLGPPRGQDSPLQVHGQQQRAHPPTPPTATRNEMSNGGSDDMEWLDAPDTAQQGEAAQEEEDMDAEELMCSTSRSSMVVNELTGQIQLCMADGTEVLPSDKVTSREKMEIVTERLVEWFEARRMRQLLVQWGQVVLDRESQETMDLLLVRRFQNKLKKKVVWRWFLHQQEEARMRTKMEHVTRKLGRIKLLRSMARWCAFTEAIRKSRMVVQHMLRRLSYYTVRGTFNVWWGKCRKKQRYLYLVEKFMARWRGNTLANFFTLWHRLMKMGVHYRLVVQRFEHRRVSALFKEGYCHWRQIAQQSICERSQSSALEALRACSVDSFFQGWNRNSAGSSYDTWCGVEIDPETKAVVQLVLPARVLERLPPEISRLDKLTSLFLEGNCLKTLPSEIGELSALQSIRLNNNRLTMLPSEIGRLAALHTLAAAGNAIGTLPNTITSLSSLSVLNLQNNKLEALPAAVGQLTGLQHVVLSGNRLADLPPSVAGLTNLETMSLSSNILTSVPAAMWKLPRLASLNLAGNKLRSIGEEIEMEALADLNLEDNLLHRLPAAIGNVTALKELNLTINQLTELPDEIAGLSLLESLNVASNRLTALPPGMAALTSLTALYAYNNTIKAVPAEIFDLARLEKLSLSTNEIVELPEGQLGKLGLMRVLSLNENKIEWLPGDMFAHMTNLEVLKLADNKLKEVPCELGRLTNLQELSLDGNDIKELPEEVSQMAGICEISMDENPIPGDVTAALTAPHADKEPLPRRTRRRGGRKEHARARPKDGMQTWAPGSSTPRLTRRQSDTDMQALLDNSEPAWQESPASKMSFSTIDGRDGAGFFHPSPSGHVRAEEGGGVGGGDAFAPRFLSRAMSSIVSDRSHSRRFASSTIPPEHDSDVHEELAALPLRRASQHDRQMNAYQDSPEAAALPQFFDSAAPAPVDFFGVAKPQTPEEQPPSALSFFGVGQPFVMPSSPSSASATPAAAQGFRFGVPSGESGAFRFGLPLAPVSAQQVLLHPPPTPPTTDSGAIHDYFGSPAISNPLYQS
eukprot:jgi/Tetstr1/445440/TSEL_033219.t2